MAVILGYLVFIVCSDALFPTCSSVSSAFRGCLAQILGKGGHSGLDFAPIPG